MPSPGLVLQLVSLTDPSCNSDISAPVLAGEEEGESSDYLMLSQSSEEPWRTALIFSKTSKLLRRGGATQSCR